MIKYTFRCVCRINDWYFLKYYRRYTVFLLLGGGGFSSVVLADTTVTSYALSPVINIAQANATTESSYTESGYFDEPIFDMDPSQDGLVTLKAPVEKTSNTLNLQLQIVPKAPALPAAKNTWLDQKHQQITEFLTNHTARLDSSLGRTSADAEAVGASVIASSDATQEKKSTVQMRVFLDTAWQQGDTAANTSLHVRARIRLPHAEKKLHLILTDDPLDDSQQIQTSQLEQHQTNTLTNQTKPNSLLNSHLPDSQALSNNASIALRYQGALKNINSDVDLGLRKGPDLFLRWRFGKEWQYQNQTSLRLNQMFRYGTKSTGQSLSELNYQYHPEGVSKLQPYLKAAAPIAKPISQYQLTYFYQQPEQDQGFVWTHNVFQRYTFDNTKTLAYGWVVSGNAKSNGYMIDHTGPWLSYRQSVWRDWFFISTETAYFDNRPNDQAHQLSLLLRLETVFGNP